MNLDRLTVDVIGRKDEAERLKRILKGTEQGYLPKVICVFGPPGSGKTLVTRKVCSDYERDSDGAFKFIYANIGEVKTVFSVANKFLMVLGREAKLSRTGLDGVMKEFWEALRELGNSGTKFVARARG